MVGIAIDMRDMTWDGDELRRRAQTKPIGWHIKSTTEQAEWETAMRKWSEEW